MKQNHLKWYSKNICIFMKIYIFKHQGNVFFKKNFNVIIPPFFDPERLLSVYDALRKMAQNIKKRAKYCINIILSIYFEQIFHKLIKEL